MAIEQVVFDWLISKAPAKVLCLGYPDLLIKNNRNFPLADDSDKIAAWHHWPHDVPSTEAAFGFYDIDATYIDIRVSRGIERVVDLNHLLPDDLIGEFDIVVDPGTIEHCFNIAQAFQNLMMACKVGGHVIHTNPINMINHGFWSISPTTYDDVYEANGWLCGLTYALSGPVADRKIDKVPEHQRFKADRELTSLVIARKLKEQPFAYPTQWKYRQNPELKANVA